MPGEKPLSAKERSKNKLKPTYGIDAPGFEPQATLMGGECSLAPDVSDQA